MKSPSDAGLYIITLGMLLVQSNYIQLQNTIRDVPLGPCCKTPSNQGHEKQRRISRVSLKRKESWYSFMYCEDRDSSRKREQTLLMSSTWTSVPCEKCTTMFRPKMLVYNFCIVSSCSTGHDMRVGITRRLRHTRPAVLISWMA